MNSHCISSWAVFMRAQSLSARTIAERTRTLTRFAETVNSLENATPSEIAAWLAGLEVSSASRATYYGHLTSFYTWACVVELCTVNPMVKVPPARRNRGVPRPVPAGSMPAIIAAATRRKTRMMVLLAAFAGLRVHEIAKIRGENIDLTTATLYVEGKGGGRAMIPVHERIREHATQFPSHGYWFPGVDGGHMLYNSVSTLITRCMRRAGVHGTAHQLRHWYGTMLLAGGTDLRVVQELMRHQSIQSTTIYTAVSDTQRRHAISTLAA